MIWPEAVRELVQSRASGRCEYCLLDHADATTGELVRLFHPRQDRWSAHFRITGSILEPLTKVGAVTAQLLRLNVAARVVERQLLQGLQRYPRE